MASSSYECIESLGLKLQAGKNKFNVMTFNADSLHAKKDLLKATVYSLLNRNIILSVICVQEAHFPIGRLNLTDLDIQGYSLETQTSKLGKHGGLAIYIHDDYKYKKRDPLCFQGDDWEALFVEVSSDFMKKPVTIGNIYRPGRNSQAQLLAFNKKLGTIIKTMGTPGKYQILTGDFNQDLIKLHTSAMVSTFYNNLIEQGFYPHVTLPTRKDTTATLLDHIWLRSPPSTFTPPQTIGSYILTDKISDHMACICSFDIQNPKYEIPKFIDKRDISELNMQRFAIDFERQKVTDIIGPDLDTNASSSYDLFYEKFSLSRDKYMPKVKKRFNRKKHKINTWITSGILKSINHKNKIYVHMNKYPKGSQMRTAKKEEFDAYNTILKKVMRDQKKAFYHEQFSRYSNHIKNTWKTIKGILNQNRKNTEFPSTFIEKGVELTNPQQIADGLNSFFTTIGPELANGIDVTGKPDVLSYMGNKTPERFFFEYTDVAKVTKIITNMKAKTSAGDDEISSIFMKNQHVLTSLAPCLTILINQSLCTGIFPEKLKLAKVIPLFKNKGDDFKFENYRPISLLSVISKVYERIVFDQIYDYFQLKKLFYRNQYGFRRKHSTESAAMELIDRAKQDMDNKKDPFAIFLDLSKAFDTIDHSIMLKKLSHYGIHGTALLWFESYLSDRVQYVSLNGNTKSKPMRITTGVPQGSILGPLLFIIYINDIKNSTNLFDVIGYADDTTLYCTVKKIASVTPRGGSLLKTSNDEIEKVNIWLQVNKLSLNPSKTRLMNFHYHQRQNLATSTKKFFETSSKICIDTVPIKKVTVFNFLGIEITSSLSWSEHINKVSSKVGKGLGILTKLKHFLPKRVLLMIYNSLIQSHLNYGILLWGFQPGKLKVLQNKAIRAITRAHFHSHSSNAYKELKILKIQDMFKLRCLKFLYNMSHNAVPAYFSENFIENTAGETRTKGASQCLRFFLKTDILPNTPRNILDKIHTHSFDGFSLYVKNGMLLNYANCNIGPDRCYACRKTR